MPRPKVYYIRHGETDWNVEGRLQGRHDIPLNARGRGQSIHCGEVLRDLFAREGLSPAGIAYLSSPMGRARETMRLLRGELGLSPDDYQVDEQLTEISFGNWEGFTIAQLRHRDPQRLAAREHDKWSFVAPGGESYRAVSARMGAWYEALPGEAVVCAHGGTARGLMAYLGIARPAAAPLVDIAQGIVYVFEGDRLTRYA